MYGKLFLVVFSLNSCFSGFLNIFYEYIELRYKLIISFNNM